MAIKVVLNRFSKLWRYIITFDVIKSLYWYTKLHLPRAASFHVYPHSIVDIHKDAKCKIAKGEFAVNASWFVGGGRRYISELRLAAGAKMIVNGDFALYQGASIFVDKDATLIIGERSFLNTDSTLNCFQHIEIGDDCMISDHVRIADSNSHTIVGGGRVKAPIVIKNHVWICKNVIILKGVTIGEGAIVAAGAVVTKDVPPHTIVAGNPARVIRENVEWK